MAGTIRLRTGTVVLAVVVLLAGCGSTTSDTAPSADVSASLTAGAKQPETDDVGVNAQGAQVGKPVLLENDLGGAAELLLSSPTRVPDSACGNWNPEVPHELWRVQLQIRVTRGPFPWYPGNFYIGLGRGQTIALSTAGCPASTLYPDPTLQHNRPALKTGDVLDGALMLGIRAEYDSSHVGYVQDAHHAVLWRIH